MLIIYRKSDNAIIDIADADAISGLSDNLAAVTIPGDVPSQRPTAIADIPGATEAVARQTEVDAALSGMISALNIAYPGLELSSADTTAEAGVKMIAAGV
jgi:hypothetical protein